MHWLDPNKRGGILSILPYLRCGQPPPLVEAVLAMSGGVRGGLYYRILNGNDGP